MLHEKSYAICLTAPRPPEPDFVTPSIRDAIQWAGTPLQEKMPREYRAWRSLKSRALIAIACLSNSAKLRASMQRTRRDLIDAIKWHSSPGVRGKGRSEANDVVEEYQALGAKRQQDLLNFLRSL